MRLSVRPSLIIIRSPQFSRTTLCAPDGTAKCSVFPARPPYLRTIRFHGRRSLVAWLLRRKENSPEGRVWRFGGHSCCHQQLGLGDGILTVFPFDHGAKFGMRRTRRRPCPLQNGVCLCLRTDSPTSKYCSGGTIFHFGSQGSRLSIRYSTQDLQHRHLHAASQRTLRRYRRAHLLLGTYPLHRGSSISGRLQRHPFSGQKHSTGKLLHFS